MFSAGIVLLFCALLLGIVYVIAKSMGLKVKDVSIVFKVGALIFFMFGTVFIFCALAVPYLTKLIGG